MSLSEVAISWITEYLLTKGLHHTAKTLQSELASGAYTHLVETERAELGQTQLEDAIVRLVDPRYATQIVPRESGLDAPPYSSENGWSTVEESESDSKFAEAQPLRKTWVWPITPLLENEVEEWDGDDDVGYRRVPVLEEERDSEENSGGEDGQYATAYDSAPETAGYTYYKLHTATGKIEKVMESDTRDDSPPPEDAPLVPSSSSTGRVAVDERQTRVPAVQPRSANVPSDGPTLMEFRHEHRCVARTYQPFYELHDYTELPAVEQPPTDHAMPPIQQAGHDDHAGETETNVQAGNGPVEEGEEGEEKHQQAQSIERDTGQAQDEAHDQGDAEEDAAVAAAMAALGEEDYERFYLKIIYPRHKTGFEETKEFPIRQHQVIAGRYQIVEMLGAAAFSRAVQCIDLNTGELVCLKIIKNNKDYFDQSLDEIKLLTYLNAVGNADEHHILQLYDYFYYKEHLFLVCELLRDNLYEFYKANRESGGEPYFTLPRIQSVARQVLAALRFIHGHRIIHCDLKPENILVKSYSRCEVKVIDFGSSCYTTDSLSSYIQSRSYRAPEVILGLPYDQRIDLWSLGCILAELWTGTVLFFNNSVPTLLARIAAILGPFDPAMLAAARHANKFFTADTATLYELGNPTADRTDGDTTTNHNEGDDNDEAQQGYFYLYPKRTSLRQRLHLLPHSRPHMLFLSFVAWLLTVNPADRPTAEEALQHPFLHDPLEAEDPTELMPPHFSPRDDNDDIDDGAGPTLTARPHSR